MSSGEKTDRQTDRQTDRHMQDFSNHLVHINTPLQAEKENGVSLKPFSPRNCK